jgi:hypothetical protein
MKQTKKVQMKQKKKKLRVAARTQRKVAATWY